MQPLISVIVPVYNAEKYIEKCLYSLTNQTYKNLEIIIVNDGSNDKSQQIIEKIKLIDNRIILLNQTNCGVSKARNEGMKISLGKYITFVDADDYVDKNYISILYNTLISNNANISICKYVLNKKAKQTRKRNIEITSFDGKKATINMLLAKNFDSSVCCKLIESKLAKTEKFCERMQIAEDCLYYYNVFKKCNKISFANVATYYYIQNESGAISNISNEKIDDLLMFERLIEECDNREIKNSLCSKYISTCFHLLSLNPSKASEEKIKGLKQTIKKYRLSLIYKRNVKFKVKIACILSYFGFDAVNNIMKIRKVNRYD